MSKKLEEIKDRVLIDKVYYKFIESKGRWGKVYTLSDEDYRYLMQQAERVEELEIQLSINTNSMKQLQKEKDEWKDTAKSYYMTNQELREQIKRYREALEKITNDEYIQDYCEEIGCYEYEAMWDIAYIALREWEKNEMR